MNLKELFAHYLPYIETEMRACLSSPDPSLRGYYGMLLYHLGWADEHFSATQSSSGKRIRPMLCALACGAAGGDPLQAVPAAAGIEAHIAVADEALGLDRGNGVVINLYFINRWNGGESCA